MAIRRTAYRGHRTTLPSVRGARLRVKAALTAAAARAAGAVLAALRIRLLDVYLERIGEIAAGVDLYVKMQRLGLRPRGRTLVAAPRERVVNECYLDYWGPYVTIVRSPRATRVMRHLVWSRRLTVEPSQPRRADGSAWDYEEALVHVQRRWEREGREPLLRIRDDHARRSRAALRELGLPDDAWFVALHVREPGYLSETEDSHRWHRNADIGKYLPAAQAVVERGGWVIRMGDPSMSRLPELPGIVDYVHTGLRSDWLDVYLAGAARFVLGTSSGIVAVATTFGVPVAGGDWVPFFNLPKSFEDVYIPRLYRDARDGRILSFREALAPHLLHVYDARRYRELGIEFVENTPEELAEVSNEMLDRLDGTAAYTQEDEARQERFARLLANHESGLTARVARDFLRRYEHLLDAVPGAEAGV
jgi:putative glycosyltransferase (TIGR04372 family)